MQPTFPHSLLERLSELLAARTGLSFPAERWGDLERGIAATAPTFGMPDAQACARWLLSAHLTRNQIEVLAGTLTVGETYFFRDERTFEVLERHILPELLYAPDRSERRVRIWSAGCCTGEEPYSIAMLVDRLIPHAEPRNVSILATDINSASLRKAAKGVYGEWSFRGTPAWIRERYFAQRGRSRFEIQEHIRRRVAFSYLNLADEGYPSVAGGTSAMDVIFCRNVLMYLTVERARHVIEHLHRSLVDGGWLIVSPAETSQRLFGGFTAVGVSGAVFYRKLATAQSPAVAPPSPGAVPTLPQAAWPAESPVVDATPATALHDAPSRLARACANQGRLAEAAQWCETAIATDKLNPANHYLLSTIQQELGQSDAATRSLMRALYIDPEFVLAHFALGNLCLLQSRRHEAERYFDNALTLLQAHPHDEPLAESEGLTAGRLAEIITSVRSSLPRAAAGG